MNLVAVFQYDYRPKKPLLSNQVQSTMTEGPCWLWQALAGFGRIAHMSKLLYLKGLDLICAIHVVQVFFPSFLSVIWTDYVQHLVTARNGLSHSKRSCLKKWHFLDRVCLLHNVVTITNLFPYSKKEVASKSSFYWTQNVQQIQQLLKMGYATIKRGP